MGERKYWLRKSAMLVFHGLRSWRLRCQVTGIDRKWVTVRHAWPRVCNSAEILLKCSFQHLREELIETQNSDIELLNCCLVFRSGSFSSEIPLKLHFNGTKLSYWANSERVSIRYQSERSWALRSQTSFWHRLRLMIALWAQEDSARLLPVCVVVGHRRGLLGRIHRLLTTLSPVYLLCRLPTVLWIGGNAFALLLLDHWDWLFLFLPAVYMCVWGGAHCCVSVYYWE